MGVVLIFFKKMLSSFLLRATLATSNVAVWFFSLIIDKLLNYVLNMLKKYVEKIKKEKQIEKEVDDSLKEYKETLNKEGATKDEIKDSGRDFLNS